MSTEDDVIAEMIATLNEGKGLRAAYQVVRRRVLEEAEDAAWKVADECNGAVSAIRVARRLHSMHTSQSAPAEPPAVTCNGSGRTEKWTMGALLNSPCPGCPMCKPTCNGTGFLPFVVSDEGRYTCPGCAHPKCPSRQTTVEGRTEK